MFSLKALLPKLSSVCLLLALAASSIAAGTAAFAEGETGSQGEYSSRGGSPWATYYRYLEENPEIYAMADKTYPHGETKYGEHGETEKKVPGPKIPGKIWPIVTQPHIPQGPEKMMNWAKTMDRVTGYSREEIGSVNLSPAFAALSMGVAGQMLADELQSPQATMPRAREEQNQQIQLSADNTAAMERQQAGCAIDFVASYLYNFTVEEGNKWNKVRNQLFLPMALLLLLPGAVLAQVKSIASQGMPVLGEISPFDGIIRSIIAIFLIPATYLVVNYGIDVANSITKVVSEEYFNIFRSNMYEDAMCAHIRAFPFREPIENKNFVPNQEAKMTQFSPHKTPFAELESKMLAVKLTDPCAKLNIVPADRANEQVKYSVNAQRNAYNTANAALAMAWNILCAFQMAYLYYLWFVGPVVAALWVYPMKQLRDAFPSWCEGVITICFWSLFWSTVVLLMACFRGVDETGTVIMTALNFLATACVKFAFDFAGLVKDAGREAGRMAEKMAHGAKGASQGGHGAQSGAQGTNGHASHGAAGQNGTHGGSGAPSSLNAGEGVAGVGADGSAGGLALGEAGNDAAGGGVRALNAGASDKIGHVSMHDFPHPPLGNHHHGNALGTVGTALGGAGLWTAIAAMAQPHFMNHGQAPAAPGGPVAPNGSGTGTGFAGAGDAGGTDASGVDAGGADASGTISGVNPSVVNEGDLYEHNWGEAALNAPIGDVSVDPDGPPLATPPINPALTLTPMDAPAMPNMPGLPPSSIADGSTGAPNMPNVPGAPNAAQAALVADITGNNPGASTHHGAHGAGHAETATNAAVAGQRSADMTIAGKDLHALHHGPGEHPANGPQTAHAGQHAHAEAHQPNAMFKDAAAGAANGMPPSQRDEIAQKQQQLADQAREQWLQQAASAQWNANQPNTNNAVASLFNTDYSNTNNSSQQYNGSQQQYIDYNNTSPQAQYVDYNSTNTVSSGGGLSNALGYGTTDATATPSGYDSSAASFAALAQSVTGDTVSALPDNSGSATVDPGISTTASGSSDYSSYSYDNSTSYDSDSATAYDSTIYGADAPASNYDYGSSAGMPYGVSTSVSASISNTDTTQSESYNNALAAGGFVAPPPDSTPYVGNISTSAQTAPYGDSNLTSNQITNNNSNANQDMSITPQPPVESQNLSFNNVDVSQVSALNSNTTATSSPGSVEAHISPQPTNHAPAAGEPTINYGNAAAAGAAGMMAASATNAQQHLRNQLAYPDGGTKKEAPINQPKPVKIKPPAGGPPGSMPPANKQSALGAALGKANTGQAQQPPKAGSGQPPRNAGGKPPAPVKATYAKGSLQDAVQSNNTRNRYIEPGKMTPEEQAELEERARQLSQSWLPSDETPKP